MPMAPTKEAFTIGMQIGTMNGELGQLYWGMQW